MKIHECVYIYMYTRIRVESGSKCGQVRPSAEPSASEATAACL